MELSAHFGVINISPPREVPAGQIRASPAVQGSRARYRGRIPAQGTPAALRGSVQAQSSLHRGDMVSSLGIPWVASHQQGKPLCAASALDFVPLHPLLGHLGMKILELPQELQFHQIWAPMT